MNIAIMTDSNSGISQEEGKENGIIVNPMPFTIDGQDYLEGINLTTEDFFAKQTNGAEIFTSQPVVGDLTKSWDAALEDHDAIIHIPMSSGLSGSCQTAMMLAQDEKYEGKVFIVDSQRISVTQKCDVYDARALAKQGKTPQEIVDHLLAHKLEATIYLTVDTLEYLKKGGRLSPAAAALAGLLKIKPILTIQGEKLDRFDTARAMKKARKTMIKAVKKDFEERDLSDSRLFVVYSGDKETALDYLEEVKEAFPGYDIQLDHLALSICCHVGPGVLAMAAAKNTVH